MPYMGVQFDQFVEFGKRRFRVFTYQAYNAMGLIGSEENGIAIADDVKRQIICDGLCKQGSGYFGASQQQIDQAEAICAMDWDTFRNFVNGCPNLRMKLEDKPVKIPKLVVPPMKDVQFMTAKEKALVLKAWFKFVLGGFRLEDFTDRLYKHLTNHASFIAHYNRGGFFGTYFENANETIHFMSQFTRVSGCVSIEYGDRHWLTCDEYDDLNGAMVDCLAPHLPAILKKLNQGAVESARADVAAAQTRLARAERSVA